ncbi:1-acyl-sn-glycerol-3-phosphate acyltransferase [Rhodococcus triatomae]|nr:1-acyl-sn-glycerol-3-phosphate acyltransferase [Rhodococcus triatomae]QNG25868.1 1-acyl-sn-glycerol-3-phosphate acyltransferase [Rhodococcus triatomae]
MPVSPCGDGCLPTTLPSASVARRSLRWVAVLAAVLASPALVLVRVLPRRRKAAVVRIGARTLLRALGIRLVSTGSPDGPGGPDESGGELVVAGHVSWVDVLVLAAVTPAAFVARGDLLEWRLLGTVARRMRVIPLDRERLRALPGVVAEVTERLRDGDRIVVFPEGTTWCGRAYGSFRPAMFQAAIDAGRPVRPIGLRYELGDGTLTTGPCFVGDETIGQSIARMVRLRDIRARVRVEPLEHPGLCRRELAGRCAQAVRGGSIDLAAHDILDPSIEVVGAEAA